MGKKPSDDSKIKWANFCLKPLTVMGATVATSHTPRCFANVPLGVHKLELQSHNRVCFNFVFLGQCPRLKFLVMRVRYSGFENGDTATYSCPHEYDLVGSSTIECQSGMWIERIPFCQSQGKLIKLAVIARPYLL